jgi:hypothetical protein
MIRLRQSAFSILPFGLFLLQASLFFVIPFFGSVVFLSPDETANAVMARAFASQGTMRIEDPLLRDAPWLHPRSFVTQGNAMVPVGFLGLPMALGAVKWLFGEVMMLLFVPMLVISVAYPLWQFMKRFGRVSQIATVAAWFSFPTVVLYANRGLFPNLPVVCLVLWSSYFLWRSRSSVSFLLSGILFGFALTIRPVEFFWMAAWIWLAWRMRENHIELTFRRIGYFLVGATIPLGSACLIAWRTYGSPFAVGYVLHDSVIPAVQPTSSLAKDGGSILSRWPFGFHPRNVWFNVKAYLFGPWAPWTILAIASGALSWSKKGARPFILVSLWTVAVTVMLYGQAIYQDHVGVNITSMGNSFLRYLLPLTPIFAISVGRFVSYISEYAHKPRGAHALMSLAIAAVVLMGTSMALRSDNESILPATDELRRYVVIRASTFERFGPQTIVLSERSDKIFFPTFRAVSPLPPKEQIHELVEQAPATVAFFSTTLDPRGLVPWESAGIGLRPIFTNENQTMYILTTATSSQTL